MEDKAFIIVFIILGIILIGVFCFAFYEAGKQNMENKICKENNGTTISENFETHCVKNECILEIGK